MKRSKGFTLAELAIAFVIIAILLAGALIPLRTQMEVRNTADTQRTMASIKEAILGFAQANGRLPCPANGQLASGAVSSGMEQYSISAHQCADSLGNLVTFGVVPWTTLGVPETDAWGRRFSYRVSPAFTDDPATTTTYSTTAPPSPTNQNPVCSPTPTPTQSSFALCSLGDIAVFTRDDSTHTQAAIGSALPAVIISYGKNGYGGWQPDGIKVSPAPVGSDEQANASGSSTPVSPGGPSGYKQWPFYSRTPTPPAAGCSDGPSTSPFCEFDDLVAMISAPTLMARMVSAGKLP